MLDESEHRSEQDAPPQKRRKVVQSNNQGFLGPGWEKYDATGLVPHYTSMKKVPQSLRKYFAQRERYFSLYNEGCLLDEEGWYSVTPERVALQIAERCRCDTILDAFCGVGGNAIAFAQTCERVIAIDNSPVRLALARHNAVIYGVQDRIEFILADLPSFIRSFQSLPHSYSSTSSATPFSSKIPKIDVVFLSPPWGGPSYISTSPAESSETNGAYSSTHPEFKLEMTSPLPGDELFHLARTITPHIAYFLPRNTDLVQVSSLLDSLSSDPSTSSSVASPDLKVERIEVEEEWMGSKLKALTCYFGGLVKGQEDMWHAP